MPGHQKLLASELASKTRLHPLKAQHNSRKTGLTDKTILSMTGNELLAAPWPRDFLHTAPPKPRGSSMHQMVPGSQKAPGSPSILQML